MKRKDLKAVRTVYGIKRERKKRKRKTKEKWLSGIECDIRTTGVCVNDVGN